MTRTNSSDITRTTRAVLFIGLFIGPVILAVTFTLLRAWVSGGEISVTPAAIASAQPADGQKV